MEESPKAAIRDGRFEVWTGGRRWTLQCAGNLEEMWAGMCDGEDAEDHIPYWVELWPSSLALAQWLTLHKEQICGQPCVDLGCGLGLTAMTGQALGAETFAVDLEKAALLEARNNSHLNGIPLPALIDMDWRQPAFRQNSIWRVWAGDIIYEARFFRPVLNFLRHVLKERGAAWIAEPSRAIFDRFLALAARTGWSARCVFSLAVNDMHGQSAPVTVRVWELVPDSSGI